MMLLYTTFGSEEDAHDIMRTLVEERLIACANITEISSIYRWKGDIVEEQEWLALCKTDGEKREKIRDRLEELHPYDIPCITFYRTDSSAEPYGAWVDRSLGL